MDVGSQYQNDSILNLLELRMMEVLVTTEVRSVAQAAWQALARLPAQLNAPLELKDRLQLNHYYQQTSIQLFLMKNDQIWHGNTCS